MSTSHVNGVDIYYEVTGQGEPLLFIHGLASSSNSWQKQIPVFSKSYQVITFDLRGHGQSDNPLSPYSIEVFSHDAAELVRSLGLSPVHVVGFSLGGMIAFQLAIEAPEMVRSLVAVNCCPEGHMSTFSNGLACCKQITRVHLNGFRKKRKVVHEQPLIKFEQHRVHRTILEQLALQSKWPYMRTFMALVSWSAVDNLDAINCPMLIVTSDEDFVPISVKEWYMSKIPNAEFAVIPNARHSVPREQSDKFNLTLSEFLAKFSESNLSPQLQCSV